MSDAIVIRSARTSDFDAAKALLIESGLPSEDLKPDYLRDFIIAVRADAPIGIIGLESFDDIGLLRSLVVDRSCRGFGIGRRLVAALEATASAKGIAELWLLTIDADGFFARLGYAEHARPAAPDSIRSTAEFSSLCPGDALLMRKRL